MCCYPNSIVANLHEQSSAVYGLYYHFKPAAIQQIMITTDLDDCISSKISTNFSGENLPSFAMNNSNFFSYASESNNFQASYTHFKHLVTILLILCQLVRKIFNSIFKKVPSAFYRAPNFMLVGEKIFPLSQQLASQNKALHERYRLIYSLTQGV